MKNKKIVIIICILCAVIGTVGIISLILGISTYQMLKVENQENIIESNNTEVNNIKTDNIKTNNIKETDITGIWRAYGYLETAYFEINEDLTFVSYYATGNEENQGKVKINSEKEKTLDLETNDGKYIMSLSFDDEYTMFNINEDANLISYIKDTGAAISERDLMGIANNSIYMLNEVLREEFSVEYSDLYKKAAFKTDDIEKQKVPDKLFEMDEDIPPSLYIDGAEKQYYKVDNFDSMEELKKHLSDYFTDNYLKTIQDQIDENFIEYNDDLYLVRGGRGYGANTVDFDSIDIVTTPTLKATVNTMLFDELDKTLEIEFVKDDEIYKINKVNEK